MERFMRVSVIATIDRLSYDPSVSEADTINESGGSV